MKHLIKNQHDKNIRSIAYFSMEIGLKDTIPTFSGGLGVLAGDTLKSFADLVVPIVGVTLLSRNGYFRQEIIDGVQKEFPEEWDPAQVMTLMPQKVVIMIEGRDVVVQAWKYKHKGVKDFEVPIFFLDTNVEENHEEDKEITNQLYGGDQRYRIKQEAVLGIAGVRILEALGYNGIDKYHMNEGHSAFLTLELLRRTENLDENDFNKKYDTKLVKELCAFTTHTPVPAGHDQFEVSDYEQIVGRDFIDNDFMKRFYYGDKINMTHLALNNSNHINGVAVKHAQVSQDMFPGYPIDSITNGVHSLTWTSDEFQDLFDKHIPGWRHDQFNLRYAISISRKEIWEAHSAAKKKLIETVNTQYKTQFKDDVFTIGFARRSTLYKRPYLLFSDIERLKTIAAKVGKIQIIYAGKAHPSDGGGKDMIKKIFDTKKLLSDNIELVYLSNYNMKVAKILISGVDIWLNTPRKPMEASGTSGMKASHNAVPNFSVLDGWWLEGHIENVTGWSIGHKNESSDEEDAEDLYVKLAEIILPMYYHEWDKWTEIMKYAIAFNASFFNTNRMVHQYVLNSYFH
jgi:glycogen phosphorylase